jgi:hypothetical protein
MAFELRQVTFRIADARGQAGLVSFVAGDADDAAQSGEWISGQVRSYLPNMKSIALQQIVVLKRARDLVANEIQRLSVLYQEAEQAQD